MLIQFQFFVVVCELNTAAYKHGRRLHWKSADFDTGNACHAPNLSFYETRLQKIRIVKVFSHCASFSIFVNHHPKCFVLCFKNTNPFLKRISSFLLCYFCAKYGLIDDCFDVEFLPSIHRSLRSGPSQDLKIRGVRSTGVCIICPPCLR